MIHEEEKTPGSKDFTKLEPFQWRYQIPNQPYITEPRIYGRGKGKLV